MMTFSKTFAIFETKLYIFSIHPSCRFFVFYLVTLKCHVRDHKTYFNFILI